MKPVEPSMTRVPLPSLVGGRIIAVRARPWILHVTAPLLVSKATRVMLPLTNWQVSSRERGLSSMPGQGNRVVGQATPGDTE